MLSTSPARRLAGAGPVPEGHGLGIAAQYSFHSYVAAVVEVAVDAEGNWTVPRVDLVIDCGQYVNPDRVKSQQEGAVVFGLSLARDSEITAATAGSCRGISTITACCELA